jgi:hypothetical protein
VIVQHCDLPAAGVQAGMPAARLNKSARAGADQQAIQELVDAAPVALLLCPLALLQPKPKSIDQRPLPNLLHIPAQCAGRHSCAACQDQLTSGRPKVSEAVARVAT